MTELLVTVTEISNILTLLIVFRYSLKIIVHEARLDFVLLDHRHQVQARIDLSHFLKKLFIFDLNQGIFTRIKENGGIVIRHGISTC